MKNFEKMILYLYPKIDKLILDTEKAIEGRISASFYNLRSNYEQAEGILDLIEAKENLKLLKGHIEDAFKNIGSTKLIYLQLYLKKDSVNMDEFGMTFSRRTLCRKIDSARSSFNSILKSMFLEEWIEDKLSKLSYFQNLKRIFASDRFSPLGVTYRNFKNGNNDCNPA